MIETIVVEEKIYDSKQNTRDELINIRKAFPISSFINSSFILNSNKSYSLSNARFIHFHSNSPLTVQIKKNGQLIEISGQLLTLDGGVDNLILTNSTTSDIKVYITYAC